jgi:hypothetical protein
VLYVSIFLIKKQINSSKSEFQLLECYIFKIGFISCIKISFFRYLGKKMCSSCFFFLVYSNYSIIGYFLKSPKGVLHSIDVIEWIVLKILKGSFLLDEFFNLMRIIKNKKIFGFFLTISFVQEYTHVF